MTRYAVLTVFCFACLLGSGNAYAVISMDVDQNMLDFRAVDPGSTIVLAEKGVYHNIITCTSTNNKTWYLKAHLVRPFTSGLNTIQNENFKWECVSIGQGRGIVTNNINIPTPFTSMPSLIYTSADTDNTVTPVAMMMRYHLTIPKNQVAGAYDAVIRLTMNEIL